MQFRNDIQGLRALAFMLVFIFHISGNWLPGGFIGVDVFFVISGYLMTNIIIQNIQNDKFNYFDFILKRIKRIVPAYYFFLILTLFATTYIYLYSDLVVFKDNVVSTALFISNLAFSKGNNYFGSTLNENPLLHTWSLAVEMQFYLIFPFVLLIFKKHTVKFLIFIAVLLTLYSSYEIYILNHKTVMYFSLFARFPEFLIGGIFAQIFKKNINISRFHNNFIAAISLGILLLSCYFISEKTPFPGFLALIPCVAAGTLLSVENNFVSDFFSKKLPVYIGKLSYSLYLWHFPLIALIRYKNDAYHLSISEVIIVCVLSFGLAWLSYTFVENKLRKLTNKNLFILFIPAYGFLFMLCWYLPTISESKKIPDLYSRPYFGVNSHNTNKFEKFGDLKSNDSILLIGDSHALMLKPFLNEMGIKNHFSFKTLTCDTFPAIPGIDVNEVNNDELKFFNQSKTIIEPTAALIKASKIIIISIEGLKRPPSEYKAIQNLSKSLRPNQFLVLINTFPILDRNPTRLNGFFKKRSNIKLSEIDNSANFKKLENIAVKDSHVFLYNLNKGLIRKNFGYIKDTVAYYDRYHINTFASKKMADEMNGDFIRYLNSIRKLD